MFREMLGICWEGLFSFNVKPTPPPELQCSGSCETENGENWGLGDDDDDGGGGGDGGGDDDV
ncbi:hypothetical protein BCON_0518g00040 [Botryotinia convoluta]|uniref:Uncharacterized protein n=1 Tax=Botryotinia convoluta TaxID=54673 RepID=A0A4Z1HAD1_9HELO|nr:hypothetical protein BCON_0518g00040 [Botryotinia convoluta]